MTIVLASALLAFAYAIRAMPRWLAPEPVGVDHWFWKTYIETYRRERTFPPHLPQYILDERQWYPPLFPMLMARLPPAVFDRWTTEVAIVIDLARMALLLAVAAWQSNSDLVVVGIAGLVYATTPIQVSYNQQLNPRGVAAIMLDGLLITLLWSGSYGTPWWGGLLVAALGGCILLTHKMTTQLLWFVLLATAVIYRRWEIALLVPVSIIAAIVFSRGFYLKVLAAHWDIVRFWSRNWRWFGADLIRESPVYGDGKYERPQKLHRSGINGWIRRCAVLFGFNPAAWVSCLLVYERVVAPSRLLTYPTPFLVWLVLPCVFACLTTFVGRLKCLGAGYLYVYNTSLLCSLILALTFRYTRAPTFSTVFLVLALTMNVVALFVYFREFRRDKHARVDEQLNRMLEELRLQPKGVVMCVPNSWYEVVAYKTSHPVLWGAHGYGFNRVEPTFPRLLLPMKEIIRRYGVRYLLTMESALTPAFEADLPVPSVTHGVYRLFSFERVAGSTESPVPAAYNGASRPSASSLV